MQKSFRRIHVGNLRALSEKLPYSVPYTVYIDPTNCCNFICPFCPTGQNDLLERVQRAKGFMTMQIYKKIIHDLEVLTMGGKKQIERLHLYKDGEPLLNPNIGEMVACVKKANVTRSVELTTNGSLLTEEKITEILDAGLDVIRVSIEHVNDLFYSQVSSGKYTYQDIINNVRLLYKAKKEQNSSLHVHVKIVDTNLTQEEKDIFINDVVSIADSWNVDVLMGWSSCDMFDYLLGGQAKTKRVRQDRIVCPEPFTKLAINFDGTVSVCCVDWRYALVIGNVLDESVSDIWFGKALKAIRIKHLKGLRSELPACNTCDYIYSFAEFANLDKSRKELLNIYNKEHVAL